MKNSHGMVLLLVAQILVLEVAMASESERGVQPHNKTYEADQPVSGFVAKESSEGEGKSEAGEAPEIRRLGKHHSTDKSVAGGGLIIGGLATLTFAAIFCYIRVTRRTHSAH